MAEWLRRLTRKPKVRTAVGSSPTLDSLVAVRNTSPGRPEPCEGNLVAVAGSCGGVMVKHPWPLLEISLSDFRGLATLNINTYIPTYPLLYEFCRKPKFDYFVDALQPKPTIFNENLPKKTLCRGILERRIHPYRRHVTARTFIMLCTSLELQHPYPSN